MAEDKAQGAIASATGTNPGPPEIHAAEKHRKYKLIDLENNEVERTAFEIVEGSKLHTNRDLWVANFRATITRVRQWCDERRDVLQMALVDVRSNNVLLYFVPSSDRYDLKLGDEMTALEMELGGSAGIGHVESLQVPERSLERFLGPKAQLVWALSSSWIVA